MKPEFDYYVVVVRTIDKEEMWVTGMEGKDVFWEDNKKALKMSKNVAEETAIGLCLNLYPAYVVAAPRGIFVFAND